MKKSVITGCMLASVAAIGCAWAVKEYKEKKAMKQEPKKRSFYRSEKKAVNLKKRKDVKTIRVSKDASLKNKLWACFEILR